MGILKGADHVLCCRAAVEEALCPLTGVTVLSVEPAPGASGLEVRVELEADGVSETAGLLLTL